MAAPTRDIGRKRLKAHILLHVVCLASLQLSISARINRDPLLTHLHSLNVSFMVVQAFYGFATDSLGLLSDTVHMFFDCVALLVGLVAAVASKWPRSQRFPYGLGKMETLSGFANGVLLM